MTDPIDQIIAGMSEAQKRAVRDASPARSNFRVLVLPLYRDRGAMSRGFLHSWYYHTLQNVRAEK